MNEAEKERLIKKDLASIENRLRHAFNQGYEMGLKGRPNCEACHKMYGFGIRERVNLKEKDEINNAE